MEQHANTPPVRPVKPGQQPNGGTAAPPQPPVTKPSTPAPEPTFDSMGKGFLQVRWVCATILLEEAVLVPRAASLPRPL